MSDFDYNNAEVDELVRMFSYLVKPTQCHDQIVQELTGYMQENEKFMKKCNLAAGKRARKHLMNLWHLVRERRAEISDVIYREGKTYERDDES